MAGPHHDAVSGNLPASDKVLADFGPAKKPKRNKYAFACAILASMISILLGYDIGVMSGAAIYIQKDLKISDVQVEILIGTFSLYSLIGSAAAGRTSDWLGRRYTIVVAGSIFFIGALLMAFATNYAFLMVGRFVAGIGVGYALMIAPVYTAEVSPASTRGFLTSFPELWYVEDAYSVRLLAQQGPYKWAFHKVAHPWKGPPKTWDKSWASANCGHVVLSSLYF
ncbi:hypothetical protein SLEP1_g58939 [Rubroshorea leprosula]|uniref:Major facilitator superfamily (MFS) profile domain-containing protein n=1 Tax=Rubroshorea leprosula TaxID=152421 RepID=A0AAV5MQY7_9ROSI|nr:hypothetical protein SLEP1_g58939 [Rubroshorea leprosula]